MSLSYKLLAGIAALAITCPLFADDTTSTNVTDTPSATVTEQSNSTDTTTTTTTTHEETKINLNKASVKELMKIKGVNATKARSIVSYRKKHGDFTTVDDLAKVRGFTKMKSETLKSIQDHLTVE